MKKQYLFAALAVTAGLMTSCSNDDELTSNDAPLTGNTITFSTSKSANQPITRSGVTLNSLEGFTVSSVNDDNTIYFADEEFNYADGIFKSSVSHYWPTSGTLSFYAISNPGTKTLDTKNVPHYTYEDWYAETDLVAATVIAGEKQMPYPLTFKHITSQVYVTAESEIKSEELTYKLISVKMDAPSTGTYSFDTASEGVGTWEIDNTKTSEYAFDDVLPLSFNQSGSANPNTCYWNILPVTDGNIDFTVEYQVYQNGKMVADCTGSNAKSCTVKNPNLIAGKRYVYNFILPRSTNDVITFTTTVSEWEDGDTTDENLSFVEAAAKNPELTWVLFSDGTYNSYDITGSIQHTTTIGTIVPTDMIDNVSKAVSVKVGTKVTEIGYKAFAGCKLLHDIDIPVGVTKIGQYAFAQCQSLESVVFPEGVTEIGDHCFSYQNGYYYGCPLLSNVTLPSTLTRIGSYAFAACYELRGALKIPENVTEIASGAFYHCNNTSVDIPDNVQTIGESAFCGCNNIETLTIPANCKLGTNAFKQNAVHDNYSGTIDPASTSLKSVTFKGKAILNGYAIFWGCINLSTIKYNSLEAPEVTSIVTDKYNAWSSTTATNAIGYNTKDEGTNVFYVPSAATYSESDIDKTKAIIFDTEYSGFTLSKSL